MLVALWSRGPEFESGLVQQSLLGPRPRRYDSAKAQGVLPAKSAPVPGGGIEPRQKGSCSTRLLEVVCPNCPRRTVCIRMDLDLRFLVCEEGGKISFGFLVFFFVPREYKNWMCKF